jgi:putative ABC transport system permease protein
VNSLTMPWRNLVGRPVRSVLTVSGIAIAIANFVAMICLSQGIPQAIENSLGETGADLVIANRGAFTLIGGSIPQSLSAKVAQISDVAEATPVLFNIMTADDQTNVPVAGWATESYLWRTTKLASGRLPTAAEHEAILLGDVIAAELKKKVGDTIDLGYRPFKIVGIAKFTSALNQNLAVTNLKVLQDMLGRGDTVSFIQVVLRTPLDMQRVERTRAAIHEIAPDFSVQDAGNLSRNLRLLQLLITAASSISLVAIVMALLGVANTLLMSVNERISEIGILRAVGWRSGQILTTIVIEGVLLATIGGIVGVALGVLDIYIVASLPLSSGLLDPRVTTSLLMQAMALAILVGAVGALLPARRAIKISPAEAMRRI